jgi:hypothetical protein
MDNQQNSKKRILDWGGDPVLKIKLHEMEALLDGLVPAVEEIESCRLWLDKAKASLNKRVFRYFFPYDAYDEIWAFLNLIRHTLCRQLPPERLSTVILQVKNSLNYILDQKQQEALKEELTAMENELTSFTKTTVTPPPDSLANIRLRLERASRICADARENHWRKVNLIRTRLLTTSLILISLLLITIVLVPSFLTCPGLSTRSLLSVAIFGALGGLVSALRTIEAIDAPSSAYYIQRTTLGLRPVVGAAAGLVIYLIQVSGIVSLISNKTCADASYLVLAFIAGFSERFFIAQIESLASRQGSTKKRKELPPHPDTKK